MTVDTATGARGYWRGLGLWNIYFIAKLILYWSGYINFHAFYNLVFASVLLLPLPPLWLHRLRHVVAVPVGIALLYYDSWLPPFQRLLDQPEVLQFSVPYLIELLSRFINWNMVGAGIVLLVTCLFLSQWVRVTVLSVGALIVASLPAQFSVQQLARGLYAGHLTAIAEPAHASPAGGGANAQTVEPTKSITDILNQELTEFYDAELTRATMFDKPAAADQAYDFDIIFLSICSLSWSDLASEQLDQHPLLKSMDVVFDEFNAATAYSGPAIRRLLRASCGQPSHAALYEDAPQHCYLFDNLQQLGFKTDAVLNHDGKFQDFIGDLAQHDGLAEPLVPMALPARWTAFDGSPVWGDYETLTHWWQGRQHDTSPRAVLYNSVTLHDGNREATADGGGRSAPYATRGQVNHTGF